MNRNNNRERGDVHLNHFGTTWINTGPLTMLLKLIYSMRYFLSDRIFSLSYDYETILNGPKDEIYFWLIFVEFVELLSWLKIELRWQCTHKVDLFLICNQCLCFVYLVDYGCVICVLDNLSVLMYRSEGIGGEQFQKQKWKDYSLNTAYIRKTCIPPYWTHVALKTLSDT